MLRQQSDMLGSKRAKQLNIVAHCDLVYTASCSSVNAQSKCAYPDALFQRPQFGRQTPSLHQHPKPLISQFRRRLPLLLPLLVPLLVPWHLQRQMVRRRGHVDLVMVADSVDSLAILTRHPALDVRRLSADLVDVGMYYDGCACSGSDLSSSPVPLGFRCHAHHITPRYTHKLCAKPGTSGAPSCGGMC